MPGAAQLAERAATFSKHCQHARTPLLQAGTGIGTTTLTRREREVVLLAATGRSSRIIAEQLGLSVRTIDNYLGSAYTKLGIHGRAELRKVIGG